MTSPRPPRPPPDKCPLSFQQKKSVVSTTMARRVFYTVATAALVISRTEAFAPPSTRIAARDGVSRVVDRSVGVAMLSEVVADTTSIIHAADASAMTSGANFLSFSDQGQNLAGVFFQASLLPYLAFLYFLSFRGNRTPALGNFGWQYLLLFVLGTIPSGIVTKSVYSSSLANVDWLHGGAEALLTITNILIVLGFREAITNPDYDAEEGSKYGVAPKVVGGLAVLLFGTACAFGSSVFDVHSAFLGGVGNLPEDVVLSLPFVMHSEPDNALSIPTWAIHFSSVFEFLFAMGESPRLCVCASFSSLTRMIENKTQSGSLQTQLTTRSGKGSRGACYLSMRPASQHALTMYFTSESTQRQLHIL